MEKILWENIPKNIANLYRKMQMSTNAGLEPLGISDAMVKFFFCLRQHGRSTQNEICRFLDLDKSTVAKMVAKLEKEGFVKREHDRDDARSIYVELTAKGYEMEPQAREVHRAWFFEVTKDLTEIERTVFVDLLERVSKNATKEAHRSGE